MTGFNQPLKLLIVENNKVDSKMLKAMLEKTPYGSFILNTCDSLSATLQLLKDEKFDVVLLDLNLQDSNGLETLQRLHAQFPDIPVVVNTGAYEDDLGLKAITQGAQDYLIKGKYLPYGLSKSLYYAIERKKAEQELLIAYTNLQEMQVQLIQAEKINVVGGLASGVAHEVKNPLATILYGIEYLNTKIDSQDEKIRLTLDSITQAAKKANRIIKDLLDFASLSIMQKRAEDIHEVLEQALKLISHQCENNGIEIVRSFTPNIPPLIIDKNRIEQVILDLILNAFYAMKSGGRLSVSTLVKAYEDADGRSQNYKELEINDGDLVVIIDIDDTGSGINEENLNKIFDPFFTTRRAVGGVGLGLSIARTIMNNHHGHIIVSNRQEGGARARLIFKV
jgi:signal transduction histidine kinase